MSPIIPVVASIACLVVGFFVGKMLSSSKAKEIDDAAKKEADIILKKAQVEADSFFEKAKAKSESIKQSKIRFNYYIFW